MKRNTTEIALQIHSLLCELDLSEDDSIHNIKNRIIQEFPDVEKLLELQKEIKELRLILIKEYSKNNSDRSKLAQIIKCDELMYEGLRELDYYRFPHLEENKMYCAFFGWNLTPIPVTIKNYKVITFNSEKETNENVLINPNYKLDRNNYKTFFNHNLNNEKPYISENNTIYNIPDLEKFIQNISPVMVRPTNLLYKNKSLFYVYLDKTGEFNG
jgi:hypothetical protein